MIIDFSVFPPFGGFLNSVFAQRDRVAAFAHATGMDLPPSYDARSVRMMLGEMNAAGIEIGVIRARHMSSGRRGNLVSSGPMLSTVVPNEEVVDFVGSHNGRFLGLASIAWDDLDAPEQLIGRLLAYPEMRGITLTPSSWPIPVYADDARILYPVYEICQKLHALVVLTIGGNSGPDTSFNQPSIVDRIAQEFPDLTLVISHAGWPFVTEMLYVAFRRPNVYLAPDMYLYGLPGWREYVDAGNGFLQDRLLFSTTYPYVPMDGAVERCKTYFGDGVFEKVMYFNAMRLLEVTASQQ